MCERLTMHSYNHDRAYGTINPGRVVTRLSLIFICLLSLSASVGLTYGKFNFAENVKFSVIDGLREKHYGVFDDYVVLWPDEILYINWIFIRSDSFKKTLNGERGSSTNLYGYLVSGIYLLTGLNWKMVFIVGVLNFLLFFYSCWKLLDHFCKDRPRLVLGAISLIALSPSVINLSSGFMRDLLLLAIVNFSFLSIYNRKYFSFVFYVVLIFFIRNLMVLALIPLYAHFYFHASRTILRLNKGTFIFLLSIIMGLFSYNLMDQLGAVKQNSFEVLLRFLELITGFNQVILNAHEVLVADGASFVEILSHLYQFLIVMCVYGYILKRRLKVNSLLIPILGTCFLLSIFYGSFLGFFVARTKLIILWLLVVFLAVSANRKSINSPRYNSTICNQF